MNFHSAFMPHAEQESAQPASVGDPEYQPPDPAPPGFPDPTQPEPQGPTEPELPSVEPPHDPEWPIPRAVRRMFSPVVVDDRAGTRSKLACTCTAACCEPDCKGGCGCEACALGRLIHQALWNENGNLVNVEDFGVAHQRVADPRQLRWRFSSRRNESEGRFHATHTRALKAPCHDARRLPQKRTTYRSADMHIDRKTTQPDSSSLVPPVLDIDPARTSVAGERQNQGSTPKSRTVVKGWKTSDPAEQSFAASSGCGTVRCIRTHQP